MQLNCFKYKVKRIFLILKTNVFNFNTNSCIFFALTMSASTSASASSSAPISTVQKGNNFEKSVLEKLRRIPNLNCKQIK